MIKKLLMMALVAAVAGGSTRPASAQTTFGGLLKTVTSSNSGPIDQSVWNVSVTQVGGSNSLLWHVLVSFNRAISANPQFLDSISVQLLDAPNPNLVRGQKLAVTGTGITTTGATVYPWDFTRSNHNRQGDFLSPVTGPNDDPIPGSWVRAGESFSGDISLLAGASPIQGVYFSLVGSGGGTGIYPGPTGITPEGASLLLFLPGLIPVAVGLRRRRLNTPKGE